MDDVLSDDDFGLLDSDKDLSIFKLKNIPNSEERAETEFVSQRKPMEEKDFAPYEAMFQKVHSEIKEGKRKILPFHSVDKNLHIGNFYIIDGVLLYLEDMIYERQESNLSKETSRRKDGRTRTIFENGTYSDMLYRSLGKQIQKNGKLITTPEYGIENKFFVDENFVKEEDFKTGWIYVLIY